MTCALADVALDVATAKATWVKSYFALAIVSKPTAGAFAVGGITGDAVKPAIAIRRQRPRHLQLEPSDLHEGGKNDDSPVTRFFVITSIPTLRANATGPGLLLDRTLDD